MSGFLQRERYLIWGKRDTKLKMPLNIANKILPLFRGEYGFLYLPMNNEEAYSNS